MCAPLILSSDGRTLSPCGISRPASTIPFRAANTLLPEELAAKPMSRTASSTPDEIADFPRANPVRYDAGIFFLEFASGHPYFVTRSSPVAETETLSPSLSQITIWHTALVLEILTTARGWPLLSSFRRLL